MYSRNHFREAITMMELCKVADCEVARASYMLSVALLLERVRKQLQGSGFRAEAHSEEVYDMFVESWVR
jgi:hypothetical protein